jgi:hypothetical protein
MRELVPPTAVAQFDRRRLSGRHQSPVDRSAQTEGGANNRVLASKVKEALPVLAASPRMDHPPNPERWAVDFPSWEGLFPTDFATYPRTLGARVGGTSPSFACLELPHEAASATKQSRVI